MVSTNKNCILFQFIFLMMVVLLPIVSSAQEEDHVPYVKNKESFMALPDDAVKREIAFFNIKASQSPKNFPKIKVKEIPLVKCTAHSAAFSKGSIGVYIHSEKFDTAEYKSLNEIFWGTADKIPKMKIESIVFEHVKFQMFLPDSALRGIFEPNFCNKTTGKNKEVYCRVFRSEDKRRVYIYMINGSGENRYEVTWVIQDSKYYTRVIDPI